ncbi:MAG: putative GNAT superfamily acetyltransferase, partial [Glaciecola sp.]
VGFALILGPGCDYASPNYAFFGHRHPDFTYVDRIAVAPEGQGLGTGRAIYEHVIATSTAPVLCAEVNVRPRNDASLAFHARLGFEALGEQETYGGSARVRMLERKLEPNPS